MSHLLYRIGRYAGRHPWRLILSWAVIAVAVVMLNSAHGGQTNDDFRLPGAESQQAADAIEDRFPQQALYTSNVIFHSDAGLTGATVKAALAETVADLADDPHVVAVADPLDPRGSTLSEDGTTAFAVVSYDVQKVGAEEFEAAEEATQAARDAGVQVEYDGLLGYAKGDEGPSSEKIAIGVAIVVLLLAFGSLVAMSLPIGVALTAILIGSSAIGILAGQVAVPEMASIVGLMLGLGVGIDYALFVLARHRQNLDTGMSVEEAVGRANATAGLSVMFAGTTVVVAIAGVQLSGIPIIAAMGWGAALMVAITMLAAVTLLPGLLGLVGRHVNSLRVPFIARKPANDPHSAASRWAGKVVAKPLPYAIVAAVVLGVLAIPVFSMRLGFADAGNDAPTTTTRKAYDLISDAYGPGVNGTLQVVVEVPPSEDDARTILEAVSDAAAADPGVASVAPPVLNEEGDLAVIDVTPTTAPQDEATAELLGRLRDDVLPEDVNGLPIDAKITGSVAMQTDVSERLGQRMPVFLGAVIGLSFLALVLLFRSILVPVKAALLNVLSVGASYGVVVAVFQWGWAADLIGVESTVPINPLAPMLMFAILFGLSMDYEVFLVSRVREQFLRHGDARRAIIEGVGSTARVITSAALIMISVFGAFILARDVGTKLFGVGFALAVLLDVTLVRMVLVPATMSVMGRRAWWLPAWLEKTLPTIDIDGEPKNESSVASPPPERQGALV